VRVKGQASDSFERLECFKEIDGTNQEGGRTTGADATSWSKEVLSSWEQCEARFVEVKGPRDTLSDKQLVWLNVLMKSEASAMVLRVQETKRPGRPSSTKAKKGPPGGSPRSRNSVKHADDEESFVLVCSDDDDSDVFEDD
jgi:hypothetical protein